MNHGPIGVVAPLKAEIAPLIRRLRNQRRQRAGGVRWRVGSLRGHHLIVATTGDGRCSGKVLDTFLTQIQVRYLIVIGVAGALSPSLAVGAMVVGDEVRDEAGSAPLPLQGLVQRAASAPGVWAGTLITGNRIATTPAEKTLLWRAHGSPTPAAVDLETAGLARVADRHRVPYVAIRAISDTAEEILPVDFNRWADVTGHVRQGAVAWQAVKQPRLIPALMGLGLRVRSCAEGLADLVEILLLEPL